MKHFFLIGSLLNHLSLAKSKNQKIRNQGIVTIKKVIHVKNLLQTHRETFEDSDPRKEHFSQIIKNIQEKVTVRKYLLLTPSRTLFFPDKFSYDESTKELMETDLFDYQSTYLTESHDCQYYGSVSLAGNKFDLIDFIQNITWKLTDEFRNIAGYNCQRANRLDSTYVVAYQISSH